MVYTKSGKPGKSGKVRELENCPGKSGNLHNWSGKIFEVDTKIKKMLIFASELVKNSEKRYIFFKF